MSLGQEKETHKHFFFTALSANRPLAFDEDD